MDRPAREVHLQGIVDQAQARRAPRRGRGEILSEATFISMSVSIRGMTDHGASSQGFFKDFRSMEPFQKKAWRIACQTHPTLTLSPPFHIGYKDPQSRSESTRISQCDFDLPQVWFASSYLKMRAQFCFMCCLKGMCWCWLPQLCCCVTLQVSGCERPNPVLTISWEWHPGSFPGSAVVNDAKMDFLAKTPLHIHVSFKSEVLGRCIFTNKTCQVTWRCYCQDG